MTGPGGPRKLLTEPYEGPSDPVQAPSEPGLPAGAGDWPASQEGVDLLRRGTASQSNPREPVDLRDHVVVLKFGSFDRIP